MIPWVTDRVGGKLLFPYDSKWNQSLVMGLVPGDALRSPVDAKVIHAKPPPYTAPTTIDVEGAIALDLLDTGVVLQLHGIELGAFRQGDQVGADRIVGIIPPSGTVMLTTSKDGFYFDPLKLFVEKKQGIQVDWGKPKLLAMLLLAAKLKGWFL